VQREIVFQLLICARAAGRLFLALKHMAHLLRHRTKVHAQQLAIRCDQRLHRVQAQEAQVRALDVVVLVVAITDGYASAAQPVGYLVDCRQRAGVALVELRSSRMMPTVPASPGSCRVAPTCHAAH